MSRYIVIPVTRREQATHKSKSAPESFFQVLDTTIGNIQSNAPRIKDISHLEALPPLPAKSAPTPKEVPLWAFRQVLIEDGLLAPIQAHIATLGSPTSEKLTNFLEYGNFISRSSPSLESIAAALGKTNAEIDAMFVRAAKLKL